MALLSESKRAYLYLYLPNQGALQMNDLIELLKLILPAGLILYTAYLMVRTLIGREQKQRHEQLEEARDKTILPLRLQAYERMCLFLERTTITNLVVRLASSGLSAQELQYNLLQEVRNEFNHNLSQQIYISTPTWRLIQAAMEETIILINQSAEVLAPSATQSDLVRQIMQAISTQKYDSTEQALLALKEEAQQLF